MERGEAMAPGLLTIPVVVCLPCSSRRVSPAVLQWSESDSDWDSDSHSEESQSNSD